MKGHLRHVHELPEGAKFHFPRNLIPGVYELVSVRMGRAIIKVLAGRQEVGGPISPGTEVEPFESPEAAQRAIEDFLATTAPQGAGLDELPAEGEKPSSRAARATPAPMGDPPGTPIWGQGAKTTADFIRRGLKAGIPDDEITEAVRKRYPSYGPWKVAVAGYRKIMEEKGQL